MNITTSKHARARQQQRGIPPLILDWLESYGATCQSYQGSEIRYFDKRSRRDLVKAVGAQVVNRLAALLDTYVVVAADGALITVGHRFKAIKER